MDNFTQPRPSSNRLGYLLSGAALLVQAPRLVLTILAADRLPVEAQTEQLLLSVAAVGTAVAVTGGGIYIAHAALTAPRWRLPLAIAWLLVLTASAGLVSPAIAGGLADQELHEIVSAPVLRAAWAVLAALAHELTAAGCMLAAAASSPIARSEEIELRLYAERDAAIERAKLAQEHAQLQTDRAVTAEQQLSEILAAAFEISEQDDEDEPKAGQSFACEWCDRPFKTKQARGGHQRSCPARPGVQRPTQGES